jgi:small subunit ribosomal protein S7
MPRKPSFKRRKPSVDGKFKNQQVSQFVNRMMFGGKKSVAERLFYEAFGIVSTRIQDKEPLDVFKQAIRNTMPVVRVKARRIGGATYQVPMDVDPRVSEALSHRWIILAARKRPGKTFAQRLAGELLDAYDNKGRAVETKEATHRMAEANKAFAHYR